MRIKFPDGTVVFYRAIEAVEVRNIDRVGWCLVIRGVTGREYTLTADSEDQAIAARRRVVAAVEAFTAID